MKLSLSTKWFLWLSIAVGIFCVVQVLGMAWLEFGEVARGDEPLSSELGEIAVLLSVSMCVFVLMLGGFRFISKRMIKPIRTIAESAHRISEGDLMERVEGESGADEIGLLASALNRAFDRHHEVVLRLDRFAGNAAHQLRTPLASITSIGEVCLQKERNAQEYRECIENMLEVTGELAGVVERLLMIARLNPSRLRQDFGPVELSHVLSQVVDIYSASLQEKNIQFSRHGVVPLMATGDAALISQAIGNIVDNAVRFSPEGGKISVTLQERDGCATLEVRDTGPGIPRNVRDVLKTEAQNPTCREELPIGRLGLAIVSEIMRIHGGCLEIRSEEGEGTCVSLVWPQTRGGAEKPGG